MNLKMSVVLAIAVALALPVLAQQGANPQPQPQPPAAPAVGAPQPPGAPPQAQQPGAPEAKAHEAKAQKEMSPAEKMARMQLGGEQADQHQFQALEQHIQKLEQASNQLRQFAGDPEKNAAETMRWSTIRDQHAADIAHIVTDYFLAQRLIPMDMLKGDKAHKMEGQPAASPQPATPQPAPLGQPLAAPQAQPGQQPPAPGADEQKQEKSDMRQAYDRQLEQAHKILVYAALAKHSWEPQYAQEMRQALINSRLMRIKWEAIFTPSQ